MGPPPGPPGMGGPSQGFQSGPPSSPPPSFVPAHSHNNNLELLQWILAVLEDVYSDIRMCG